MEDIKAIIQEVVDETIVKLKKAKLIKGDEKIAYKKTEELLKSYKDMKAIPPEEGSSAYIMLRKVDEALEVLENDDYCGLIQMIYEDGKTREECAEFYGVEPVTISRNKKRLVDRVKNIIFSDDVIRELFL